MAEHPLKDLVAELVSLNDDNLSQRVIDNFDVQWCLAELFDILDAGIVSVRHGRWIENTDGIYCWIECSECGGSAPRDIDTEIVLSDYCHHCGAKMDLKEGAENG